MTDNDAVPRYPTLTDPNVQVDPAAARMLVHDQHALGVATSGDVLLVALEAPPTPARYAELEAVTGMALTIALADRQMLAHLRGRALAQPAGEPGVILGSVLNEAERAGASDVLLATGRRPCVRIGGQYQTLAGYPQLAAQDVTAAAAWFAGTSATRTTVTAGSSRWRTEVTTSAGRPVLALHRLPSAPVKAEVLHLPSALAQAASARHGLVLVASPYGGGRTTTAAGVVDLINASRQAHVVSIASPVEYQHRTREAVVTTLEIGRDVATAADGVRTAGRLGADVVELDVRTGDDAHAAVDAAASGHLVIAVVAAVSVESAIRHVAGLVGAQERRSVLQSVAASLRVATAQQLLPTVSGHPGAVFEVLTPTDAVRSAIREDALSLLPALIEDANGESSTSMDRALALNVAAGRLHLGTARQAARDPGLLDQHLAHTSTSAGSGSLREHGTGPVLTPAATNRPADVSSGRAPAPAHGAAVPAGTVLPQPSPGRQPAAVAPGRQPAPAAPTTPAAQPPAQAPRRATLRGQH